MIEASEECSNCGVCDKRSCGSCDEVIEITCLTCKKSVCQDHLALCWCQRSDGICVECTECNNAYPVSHFYNQEYGYICYDVGDPVLCNTCI